MLVSFTPENISLSNFNNMLRYVEVDEVDREWVGIIVTICYLAKYLFFKWGTLSHLAGDNEAE